MCIIIIRMWQLGIRADSLPKSYIYTAVSGLQAQETNKKPHLVHQLEIFLEISFYNPS